MSVKLDWQFGEDENEDDDLRPRMLTTKARIGSTPTQRYRGTEKNPELLRLRIRSRFTVKDNRNNLYLSVSFLLIGFLWAMYYFV